MTPFRIAVDDEVLTDLRQRLSRTRFPKATPGKPWDAGTDPAYLRELVGYWENEFDWRARERRLNEFPQFTAGVDGMALHFVHVRSDTEDAIPLVLIHGWPSSFAEMLPLVPLLSEFDLVIPSLPGIAFSSTPDEPITRPLMADAIHNLMTTVLGYERYGAYGGDVGADVTHWLATRHPEQVLGIHTIHPRTPQDDPLHTEPYDQAELDYLKILDAEDEGDGGYSHMQETRPDTLAASLEDSPAGLAAWIVEKYRTWGDCHGDLESRFSKDTLLSLITLYWTTQCVNSSFRSYYDYKHNPRRKPVRVPTGITLSVEDRTCPRRMAERTYSDIRHWSNPGKGGHFFPLEEPELLAEELRTFFTALS